MSQAMRMSAVLVAVASTAVLGSGVASATPTPLESKHDSTVTDDGWQLDLACDGGSDQRGTVLA